MEETKVGSREINGDKSETFGETQPRPQKRVLRGRFASNPVSSGQRSIWVSLLSFTLASSSGLCHCASHIGLSEGLVSWVSLRTQEVIPSLLYHTKGDLALTLLFALSSRKAH